MRLPQSPLPMLRVVTVPIYPVRVHCAHPGCLWSVPCRDHEDAYDLLEQHLNSPWHQRAES